MFKIVADRDLVPQVHLFEIEAPAIARKAKAGQFIMLRSGEKGERIPLTLADWDRERGTITTAFMEVGKSTRQLATLKAGDAIQNCAGPLGLPTHIDHFGTVVVVAGGVGVAAVVPIARALKAAGNRVVSILGARSQDLLFWEDRLAQVSDEFILTTDDGSRGRKGVVTQPLREMLERGDPVERVIAIGPTIMMKFCSLTTLPFNVPTIVSLNAIMVDGTGMCGTCRVSVGGETKFSCVDGPDFNGHLVDWDELAARRSIYLEEEKVSLERWAQHSKCAGGCSQRRAATKD